MDSVKYIESLRQRIENSKRKDKEFFDSMELELNRLDAELEEIRLMLDVEEATLDFTSIELDKLTY